MAIFFWDKGSTWVNTSLDATVLYPLGWYYGSMVLVIPISCCIHVNKGGQCPIIPFHHPKVCARGGVVPVTLPDLCLCERDEDPKRHRHALGGSTADPMWKTRRSPNVQGTNGRRDEGMLSGRVQK